jgi:hypothetical protein
MFGGEIEVDESYFGVRRKSKRGRGAAGKILVFGLLKRGGKVYTKIIPDASSATPPPIIERKDVPDSIVYSGVWIRLQHPGCVGLFITFGSTIPNSLQTTKLTSTGSKPSRSRRSVTFTISRLEGLFRNMFAPISRKSCPVPQWLLPVVEN